MFGGVLHVSFITYIYSNFDSSCVKKMYYNFLHDSCVAKLKFVGKIEIRIKMKMKMLFYFPMNLGVPSSVVEKHKIQRTVKKIDLSYFIRHYR